jgi:hypothetical protein
MCGHENHGFGECETGAVVYVDHEENQKQKTAAFGGADFERIYR